MGVEMDEKIEEAIRNVLALVRANIRPDEALKYTQAALNLAQVKGLMTEKKRASA